MSFLPRKKWKIKLGIILFITAALTYLFAHFVYQDKAIFHLVVDLAFMPLEVLVVALVIEGIISKKEKDAIVEKLDMIMNVFFSEVGMELLSRLNEAEDNTEKIRHTLSGVGNWSDSDYGKVLKQIQSTNYVFNFCSDDGWSKKFLVDLRKLLVEKREFLIRLLENPNLLEKDNFSNLLLAIFHLDEELEGRDFEANLPPSDYHHLVVDTNRVYSNLICEWINHLSYLKKHYPYMFSVAVRTNPFDRNASILVTE